MQVIVNLNGEGVGVAGDLGRAYDIDGKMFVEL